MRFLTTYYWDRGCRENNQDSITIQSVTTRKGPVCMACVCDGVGGLPHGEIASGYIVEELTGWFYEEVVPMMQCGTLHLRIRKAFYRKSYEIHRKMKQYSQESRQRMGSTCTCLVITRKKYFIFHIGDTRSYKIGMRIKCLTRDHMADAHTLAKCMESGKWNRPDCRCGSYRKNEGFLLCSDGYRHYTSEQNFAEILGYGTIRKKTEQELTKCLQEIGKRNKHRGETDNMSAIYLRQTG
ncbi:MAG: serine/threonine-protein phosphatase [Lachnospiraceae bacterium]|nr:serine/threonine-protein phosphatase [Lachnospiraceae bacterium]